MQVQGSTLARGGGGGLARAPRRGVGGGRCLFVCMFVCLSAGYTHLIEPRLIHVFYMGRSAIYRQRFLSKKKLDPDNASSFTSENVRNSHIFLQFFFLSDVASNGIPNDMYFIIYLYYRISNDISYYIFLINIKDLSNL